MNETAFSPLNQIETPKQFLRHWAIQRRTRSLPPGTFLEVGSGRGAITELFLALGYDGLCYDLGDQNRAYLRDKFRDYGERVRVVDSLADVTRPVDYLFSFEVLEHIEDDLGVVRQWCDLLAEDACFVGSVPAHARKFDRDDEMVGHVRRYEKQQLRDLLLSSGFHRVEIWNYGFPLGNFTRWVNKALLRPAEIRADQSKEQRSIRSGVERSDASANLSRFYARWLLLPFAWMQQLTFNRDWGDGYIFLAVKS